MGWRRRKLRCEGVWDGMDGLGWDWMVKLYDMDWIEVSGLQ